MKTTITITTIIASLALAAPAMGAPIDNKVKALQAQTRTLRTQNNLLRGEISDLRAQIAALRDDLNTSKQTALDFSTCMAAKNYDIISLMWKLFGEQIASMQGKTLTPATLKPFDDAGACQRAGGTR